MGSPEDLTREKSISVYSLHIAHRIHVSLHHPILLSTHFCNQQNTAIREVSVESETAAFSWSLHHIELLSPVAAVDRPIASNEKTPRLTKRTSSHINPQSSINGRFATDPAIAIAPAATATTAESIPSSSSARRWTIPLRLSSTLPSSARRRRRHVILSGSQRCSFRTRSWQCWQSWQFRRLSPFSIAAALAAPELCRLQQQSLPQPDISSSITHQRTRLVCWEPIYRWPTIAKQYRRLWPASERPALVRPAQWPRTGLPPRLPLRRRCHADHAIDAHRWKRERAQHSPDERQISLFHAHHLAATPTPASDPPDQPQLDARHDRGVPQLHPTRHPAGRRGDRLHGPLPGTHRH